MDELTIVWTLTALKQRNQVFKYWNLRNNSNAYSKRLNLKNKEKTTLLKDFPEMGNPTEKLNLRKINLEHFSIFYKVFNYKIIIVAFWDNRQDPKTLLKFLKQN